jgi:proprotein convertase subtilisin/kexin type 5
MCTQCTAGYYLYSGQCVASCPIVPVVTYANINGTCGTSLQCSAGYFALNSTKSCVTTCPSGYYKNSITQTCEYCMKGCSNCNNYSVCLACDQVNALWDNYICYPYCSRLMHYYYGSGCVSACPAGTYLNLTFCTACSAICGTCQLQPSNCLTCADGLYLQNHLCV